MTDVIVDVVVSDDFILWTIVASALYTLIISIANIWISIRDRDLVYCRKRDGFFKVHRLAGTMGPSLPKSEKVDVKTEAQNSLQTGSKTWSSSETVIRTNTKR